ncbi:MAG: hypothetical protein ACLS49_04645 [Christensenellales bacterium]
MFTIPVKMKAGDEFFDFVKKFQKIGEIEEETFLMGVKCFDSDGYLSRIKLFFITDEKEADAVLFNDKIDNYCILKSYGRFKDNLKDEMEKFREELEKRAVMDKLNVNKLSNDDYWECMTGESVKLTLDEASEIYASVNEKLQTVDMQNEVFKRTAERLAKEIAQYYVTKVILDDTYCRAGKLVVITGTDYFVHFIEAIPAEEKMLKRKGNKKIVTDGRYVFVWAQDGLFWKIDNYNKQNNEKMIEGEKEEFNGFFQSVLKKDGLNLLDKFCSEDDVELVRVPEWSVDRYDKLEELLQAAGITEIGRILATQG